MLYSSTAFNSKQISLSWLEYVPTAQQIAGMLIVLLIVNIAFMTKRCYIHLPLSTPNKYCFPAWNMSQQQNRLQEWMLIVQWDDRTWFIHCDLQKVDWGVQWNCLLNVGRTIRLQCGLYGDTVECRQYYEIAEGWFYNEIAYCPFYNELEVLNLLSPKSLTHNIEYGKTPLQL